MRFLRHNKFDVKKTCAHLVRHVEWFHTFGGEGGVPALMGKSVDEVLKIKNTDIASHLKLPPVKLHCSMLAEDAIKAAVKDWKSKQSA